MSTVLEVKDLVTRFHTHEGTVHAVNSVSFHLDEGETLGVVGESGCGKSVTMLSLLRLIPVPPGKIEVIYSGTDLSRFHPDVDAERIRDELGLEPGHALITQVGIRSWRGNDDVLDAMARVHREAPHARLLLVGSPPPRIRILLEKARTRGLEGVVSVLGHREDIPEILAASDVVVDASYAGLGLTGSLREALAVETPVIGTNLEGMPELILDGETGLLVPPRNPEALAQALLRVIENPARAKAMARAGRKRVEALFSLATKLERIELLYARLLASAEGTPR